AEQQSPFTRLPSSHSSPAPRAPSPHTTGSARYAFAKRSPRPSCPGAAKWMLSSMSGRSSVSTINVRDTAPATFDCAVRTSSLYGKLKQQLMSMFTLMRPNTNGRPVLAKSARSWPMKLVRFVSYAAAASLVMASASPCIQNTPATCPLSLAAASAANAPATSSRIWWYSEPAVAGFQSTARLLPLTANLTMATSSASASASVRPSLISDPKPSFVVAKVRPLGSDWYWSATNMSPESMRSDGSKRAKYGPSSNQNRTSVCGMSSGGGSRLASEP